MDTRMNESIFKFYIHFTIRNYTIESKYGALENEWFWIWYDWF